jgi:hypothetical protein
MSGEVVTALVWLGAMILLIVAFKSKGARRPGVGSAAMGSVYDLLNEDKRKAIEIIVEERAEARDPEDKDCNLPELESPR